MAGGNTEYIRVWRFNSVDKIKYFIIKSAFAAILYKIEMNL